MPDLPRSTKVSSLHVRSAVEIGRAAQSSRAPESQSSPGSSPGPKSFRLAVRSWEAKPVKHQQASLVHRSLRKTILALLMHMGQTCHVSGQACAMLLASRTQCSMASQRITCEHCSKTCTTGGSRSTITCHSGRLWYIIRVLQCIFKVHKGTLQKRVGTGFVYIDERLTAHDQSPTSHDQGTHLTIHAGYRRQQRKIL